MCEPDLQSLEKIGGDTEGAFVARAQTLKEIPVLPGSCHAQEVSRNDISFAVAAFDPSNVHAQRNCLKGCSRRH